MHRENFSINKLEKLAPKVQAIMLAIALALSSCSKSQENAPERQESSTEVDKNAERIREEVIEVRQPDLSTEWASFPSFDFNDLNLEDLDLVKKDQVLEEIADKLLKKIKEKQISATGAGFINELILESQRLVQRQVDPDERVDFLKNIFLQKNYYFIVTNGVRPGELIVNLSKISRAEECQLEIKDSQEQKKNRVFFLEESLVSENLDQVTALYDDSIKAAVIFKDTGNARKAHECFHSYLAEKYSEIVGTSEELQLEISINNVLAEGNSSNLSGVYSSLSLNELAGISVELMYTEESPERLLLALLSSKAPRSYALSQQVIISLVLKYYPVSKEKEDLVAYLRSTGRINKKLLHKLVEKHSNSNIIQSIAIEMYKIAIENFEHISNK